MYIKVFESRQSSNCYTIKHELSLKGLKQGVMCIENQDKKRLVLDENELFPIIDCFFKVALK